MSLPAGYFRGDPEIRAASGFRRKVPIAGITGTAPLIACRLKDTGPLTESVNLFP